MTRPSSDRIGTWSRAACGWREAQTLNVARFGDNMRHVAVTEGDKVEAQLRLGIAVDGYGVGDLVDAVRDVSDAAVDVLVDEYEHLYMLVPALQEGGVAANHCGTQRGSRRVCAVFSSREASRRSRIPSRIWTAYRNFPASPCSA